MGLLDFIKGQFIEVIEWTDSDTDTMVHRFDVQDKEIKMGAQLTVRASQAAVFVNEGEIADVFTPGRYTLNTENLPVLTKLASWKYGFNSPFKSEVYFVNTKQFTDQKWGTTNPVMMRDAEFGMLRLRAYGIYSFNVKDPVKFMEQVFGTNQHFTTDQITEQLKRTIVSGLTDVLGESKVPALDLAMYYDELGEQTRLRMQEKFEKFGLDISTFIIENISLPPEVEKVLDKRTSMGVLGDMNKYTQYQAAEAIREAAQNESGFAGTGVGLGTGAAIGNIMGNTLNNMNQQQQPQTVPVTQFITCPACQSKVAEGKKFCSECGKSLIEDKKKCIKCSAELKSSAKFCPECGTKQDTEKHCSDCGAKLSPTTKFCPECGSKSE